VSIRFVARIVFVLAMAFSLSAPLAATVAGCNDTGGGGYC
jgi:hypothetical protein